MNLTLEAIGITKEELQSRVVEQIAQELLTIEAVDEDGDPFREQSKFAKGISELVRERINDHVAKIAEAHVLPRVGELVDNIVLQETNKWGEKRGAPMTLIEYLTSRAEAYLREEVSYDGKSKGHDSYSWKGTQTRIAYLVHQHFHYAIEQAMGQAVKSANSVIVGGIQETVRLKLGEIAAALKVEVKSK